MKFNIDSGNFNSGNDNKLVHLLAKSNYFLCTCYVSNIVT